MIFPIGHEESAVRRLPGVTLALIAICLVVQIVIDPNDPGPPSPLERAAEYWVEHAYLEVDPQVLGEVLSNIPPERQQGVIRSIRYQGLEQEPLDGQLVAAEQREFDRLTERARQEQAKPRVVPRNAYTRWGLVPVAPRPESFLTHMFVHAGWIHLLGNLFLLLLAGPPIEDRWGRPLFAVFFLLAGASSGAAFAALTPDSALPLIGASGAIAGVMGAFFVRCWKARLHFFYLFFIGFRFLKGTFHAPAWAMLLLWFANELAMLAWHPTVAVEGGTAYAAHVGGFLFGAAFALAVRASRVEERIIHPAIESKITVRGNPVLEQAMRVRESGELERACQLLEAEVAAHPDDSDAVLAYWDTASALGRGRQAVAAMLRLVKECLARGKLDLAARYWEELGEEARGCCADPNVLIRVVPALLEQGKREHAIAALRQAVEAADPPLPPGLALRAAHLGRSLDPSIALQAAHHALEAPELPDTRRDRIEELIATLEVVSGSASAGDQSASESEPIWDLQEPDAVHLEPSPSGGELEDAAWQPAPRFCEMKVTEAVPLELGEGGITLALPEGKQLALPYQQIQALAVAAVRDASSKPVLIVDLVSNWNDGDDGVLRLVRMRSDAFDPRPLVPKATRAAEAIRELLSSVLSRSGAVPLPDQASVLGRPFPVFDDLEAYEQEVLQRGV